MSTAAFMRQEVIPSSAFNPTDLRCPRCNGNTLVLSGHIKYTTREVMEQGVITDVAKQDDETFDINRVDCVPCQVTFQIKDVEVFHLQRENSKFREVIRKTTGTAPQGTLTVH